MLNTNGTKLNCLHRPTVRLKLRIQRRPDGYGVSTLRHEPLSIQIDADACWKEDDKLCARNRTRQFLPGLNGTILRVRLHTMVS